MKILQMPLACFCFMVRIIDLFQNIQFSAFSLWGGCHVNYYLSVKVIRCYAYIYGMPVETETMMNSLVYIY